MIFLSGVQQVRLDHNGKFSNADVHGVHSENGPVLSEELGKKYVFFNWSVCCIFDLAYYKYECWFAYKGTDLEAGCGRYLVQGQLDLHRGPGLPGVHRPHLKNKQTKSNQTKKPIQFLC